MTLRHRLATVAWGLWAAWAVVFAFWGQEFGMSSWIALAIVFLALEGIGVVKRTDDLPTLTEEIAERLPGWITFPLLGLALWRLMTLLPSWMNWAIFVAGAWGIWHFDRTYDTRNLHRGDTTR